MKWDRVEGNWKQIKGKAQQKWGNIANDSLDVIGAGMRTALSDRLQERSGIVKERPSASSTRD